MCGYKLYNRNQKIQMLRDQFMLSKKLYYSYLLNYTDEYWRNIYLKFKEKIRKTSFLVMTINNVLYKAHIKRNQTDQINQCTSRMDAYEGILSKMGVLQTNHRNERNERIPINDITRRSETEGPLDTTRIIKTEGRLDTNKGNKSIPYHNLMHLIIRMKIVKIKDKKAIKINRNKLKNSINFIKVMIAIRKDNKKKKNKKKI